MVDFQILVSDLLEKLSNALTVSFKWYDKVPSVGHFFIALAAGVLPLVFFSAFWAWAVIVLVSLWRLSPYLLPADLQPTTPIEDLIGEDIAEPKPVEEDVDSDTGKDPEVSTKP